MTTDVIYKDCRSDWSHQVSAMGTTRWLKRDQTLPLSAKGVACKTSEKVHNLGTTFHYISGASFSIDSHSTIYVFSYLHVSLVFSPSILSSLITCTSRLASDSCEAPTLPPDGMKGAGVWKIRVMYRSKAPFSILELSPSVAPLPVPMKVNVSAFSEYTLLPNVTE